MTFKKKQKRLAELQEQERRLFDTYKVHKKKEARAEHLEEMAACIREQIKLEK